MSVTEGRGLRDGGIAQVLGAQSEQWKRGYRNCVLDWFGCLGVGATFTGETLRMVATRSGVGEPHHPNAWGGVSSGVIREWLKSKQVRVIGLQSATDARSHAHVYRMYEKLATDDGLGDLK